MDEPEHGTLGAQHALRDTVDNEEQEHFQQVCQSYQQYATFHQTRQQGVNLRLHRLLNEADATIASLLPPSLLPHAPAHQRSQTQFCDATIRNQFFLDNVLKYSGVASSQEARRQGGAGGGAEWATEDQMSKIDSVLKSVARDWSREGREERSAVYDRLVGALEKYLPNGSDGREDHEGDASADMKSPPRVAVPGSGLGRLGWELYSRGYSVQGSDFSLPMLLASDFVLNGCGGGAADPETGGAGERAGRCRQFGISPWLAETKNTASFGHRTRAVVVPDVDPTSLQHHSHDDADGAAPEFTMLAGEFLTLYADFLPCARATEAAPRPRFHAVVCSFFLDTAPSLPHYLLTLYHMLEVGGLLLHFGPLMYHWSGHGCLLPGDGAASTHENGHGNGAGSDLGGTYQRRTQHLDARYLSSIDYTWEEVRHMVLQCGFEIEEEETHIPARYTADASSMMKVDYDCVFMVARKKPL